MKTKYLILHLILFYFAFASAQTKLEYYASSEDYLNNVIHPMELEPSMVISEGDDHIQIRRVVNKETGEKDWKAIKAWAIDYNGELFINMGYSEKYKKHRLFCQPSIVGRFCVIEVNKDNLAVFQKEAEYGSVFGLVGLIGSTIDSAATDRGMWFDENQEYHRLIVFDTQKKSRLDRIKSSVGLPLKVDNINEILEIDLTIEQRLALTYEDVILIIENKNWAWINK